MPRVGFAYDLTGDGKTSLRGGSGIFYNTRMGGDLLNTVAGAVAPFIPAISITQPQGPFSNPYLNLANPYPAPATPPKDVAFAKPLSVETVDGAQAQQQTPRVYNWNISIERQIGAGWLFRAAYVGTHGSHIRELVQLNPAVYIPGSTLSTDARRVFPGYGGITQQTMDVNSLYNGGQFSVEKRVSQSGFLHALTMLANYTWSKAIDTLPVSAGVENTGVSTVPFWSTGRRAFDTGRSDFDHRHRMVVSYNMPLPRFSGSNALVKGVFGSWELSGVFTVQSADALTITSGRDQSLTGIGQDRAVVLGPARGSGACGSLAPCVDFYNRDSFGQPAVGAFGNAGRNSVSGPGLFNWDMAFLKNFPFRERFKFQFRAEFFNIYNHLNLGDPATALTSVTFGAVRSANDPRISQLALKFFF